MGTSEMRFGGGVPEVDHDAQQGNKGFQSVVVEEELREHVQWSQPQPPQRMSLYPWFVPFEPANDPFEFEDTLPPYNFAPNPLFGYETKSTYANEAPFGAEVSIPHVVGEKVPLKKLEAISRTKQRQRPEQGVALVSPADSISLKQLVGFHDVKQRQKQELDNKVVMLETPSPKTAASPPVEATRLKLRESLTSALQIVDSSQIGNAELDAKADGISDGNAHSNELKRMKQSEKGDIDMVGFDEAARQVGSDAPQLEVGGAVGKDIGKDMSGPDDEVKLEIDLSAADAVDSTSKGSDVEMKDGHSENIMAEVELLQQRVVEQARKVAVSIESQLFILFGGVNKKYREKARSLLFNLKDKSNPELRARVFSGEITPEALCSMTAEDLASKELSEWRTAKAEELSHAVVLTDADVDPRFIVKKTHKGEFQVEVEKDVMDVLPPPELTANRSSQTKAVSKEAIELVKEVEDLQPQEQEQLEPDPEPEFDIQQQQQADLQQENIVGMDSPIPVADGGVVVDDKEMVTDMVDGDSTPEVALDPNLPAIPSMDDFQESRDASRDPVVEEKVVEKISKEEVDKTVQPAAPELVWQGNLQTNTSKLTPIRVFFRSGDKADLSEWSKLIEVKGRVRLAALTKFLQELQSSRSRSVMVLSICKQEEQDGGSSTSNLLTEVAEQYRTGERVGYAEPSPGFELYLLPPGNDTTKLLAEHGHPQDSSDVIGEGEELLMGVVVWRKNQTQSSVPSRGPNQNKRVGFSGKSSVSPSTSEAPKSGLTSSRKGSASSAAHVSHGLSMQKHIESDSSTRTPVRDSFRHSPSVTNSVNYQQQPVAPLAGVKGAEERSAGLSKESSLASRQQTSLPSRRANHDNDLADVPPGFFPVPSPFAPDAASRGQSGSSTGAALTSAVPSPLSKLSSHGDPRVLSQLVPAKKDEEMVEAPPGFWPRGPQALRPPSPTDEDDLPEFDFGSGSSQRGMLGTGQQVVSGSAELALKNSLNPESAPNQFGVEVPKEQSLLNSGVPVYPHPTSRFYNDLHNARDYTSPSPAGGAYNLQQTPAAAAASVYSQQGLGSGLDQRFLGNQQQSAVNLSSLPLAQDLSYLNASGRRDYPAESLARQGQMDSAESLMSRAGTHLPNVGGQSFGVTDATALQYARGGMLNQQLRAGPLPEWRPQVAPGVATYQAPRPAMSMMNNTNPGVFAAQQQQRFSAVVQARSALPADPSWARGPAPQQLLPDAAAASRAAPGTAPAVGPVGAQVGAGVGGVGMPKWQHPNQFQRTIYATRKPVEIKDTAAALRQREILNARDAYPGRSGDPYSANSTRSRDPRKHRRDRSRSRDRGRGRSRERSRSRDRGRSRSKDRHRQKDKDKETGRGRERERERSGDRSRGRSRSRSRSRGRSRERSRERSKEKSTERNRERSRERERDRSASPKNSK